MAQPAGQNHQNNQYVADALQANSVLYDHLLSEIHSLNERMDTIDEKLDKILSAQCF